MLKLGINIVQLTPSHTSSETCVYSNPSNMEAVHAQRPKLYTFSHMFLNFLFQDGVWHCYCDAYVIHILTFLKLLLMNYVLRELSRTIRRRVRPETLVDSLQFSVNELIVAIHVI